MIHLLLETLFAGLVSAGTTYAMYKRILEDAMRGRIEQHMEDLKPRIQSQFNSAVQESRVLRADAHKLHLRVSQHAQNAEIGLSEVRTAIQRLEELEIRAATHLQHTEKILNEPHIRRYLRSG